jgi:hypothetical protein
MAHAAPAQCRVQRAGHARLCCAPAGPLAAATPHAGMAIHRVMNYIRGALFQVNTAVLPIIACPFLGSYRYRVCSRTGSRACQLFLE